VVVAKILWLVLLFCVEGRNFTKAENLNVKNFDLRSGLIGNFSNVCFS